MSSYAELYLRGVEIFSWRNEIDPTFLYLFTSEDVHRSLDAADDTDEYEPREIVQLTATNAVLRDRLDVLGISRAALQETFDERVKENLERLQGFLITIGDTVQPDIDLFETLTLDGWTGLLVEALKSPDKRERGVPPDPTSLEALLEIWEYDDPRFLLGAVLLACEPDEEVSLDVSELIVGGWMDGQFDPQLTAIEHFGYSLANGSPPVVITEGSTDAQFLQAARRVRQPHLRSYIKFLDFADGAEGSAAAGVRTLKSFAAAGIRTGSFCCWITTPLRVTQYGRSEV